MGLRGWLAGLVGKPGKEQLPPAHLDATLDELRRIRQLLTVVALRVNPGDLDRLVDEWTKEATDDRTE